LVTIVFERIIYPIGVTKRLSISLWSSGSDTNVSALVL